MTRLQTLLLVLLTFVTAVVFAQADTSLVLPAAAALISALSMGFAALRALFAAVPTWAWWMAFGITMSVLCPRKLARFGGGCGRYRRHTCARVPGAA